MQVLTRRLALVIGTLVAFSVPIGAQPGSKSATAPGEASEAQVSPSGQRRVLSGEQRQALVDRIWWNQKDVIAKLGLKKLQRDDMNRALQSFFDADEEKKRSTREAQSAFATALQQSELAVAGRAAVGVGEAAAAAAQVQPTLKIEVLRLLSAEQRTNFIGGYPHLLRQPWIRLRARAGRNVTGQPRKALRPREPGNGG